MEKPACIEPCQARGVGGIRALLLALTCCADLVLAYIWFLSPSFLSA